MGNRQPTYLCGLSCSVPEETFREISRKWNKKLRKRYKNKKDYDSAMLNSGYIACTNDPNLLSDYVAQIKQSQERNHSYAISKRFPSIFKRRKKPKSTRLGPKISQSFARTLRRRYTNDQEASIVLAAYALIGFEAKNGSPEPFSGEGEYLNGDPVM